MLAQSIGGGGGNAGTAMSVNASITAGPNAKSITTPVSVGGKGGPGGTAGEIAITSATGQLFIFYTIKKFGPVIFTIMMTTRQMISLVVSCMMFGHSLGQSSIVGAVVVFGVLLSQVYTVAQRAKCNSDEI